MADQHLQHPPSSSNNSTGGQMQPPPAPADGRTSPSSLLHLLAAASSDLPAKISSSYHLHELPSPDGSGRLSPAAAAGPSSGPGTSVIATALAARSGQAAAAAGSPVSSSSPAGGAGTADGRSAAAAAAGSATTPAASSSTAALKRKASSLGPADAEAEARKEVKNGNNKVTLSCAECRRLKLKCDRVWPCSNCKKRGVATICPTGELKGGKGKRLILADTEELHARISALESALHESHSLLTASRAGGAGADAGQSSGPGAGAAGPGPKGATSTHPLLDSSFHYEPLDGGGGGAGGSGAAALGNGAGLGSSSGSSGRPSAHERGVGEDNIGRLSAGRFFGFSAGSAYLLSESTPSPTASPLDTPYGPSSAASPQFGGPSLSAPSSSSSSAVPVLSGSGAPSAAAVASTVEMLLGQLPSREQAWALSDSYFRNGSWMYCVIKRTTFDADFFPRAYPGAGTRGGPMSPHALALFFMVLALGALFDLNSAPYNQLSKRYYALAKAALALDPAASVVHVQTIMLMGTLLLNEHSHATSGGEEFWPMLGLAMKHAVALGLHRDGQNWNLPKEEVDERRRVFLELDTYETLQALCLGRPRSLASHAIDTKAPGSNSEEDRKNESIFHQTKYKLLPLIKRVNDLQVQTTPCTYDQIITLDHEFRAFERKLPAELHCSEDSCVLPTDGNGWVDKTLILQRHAMLTMINESLLFLHRGWFARALRDFPDEPLKARWSRSYIAELESCKTIISVVKDVLQLQGSLVTRHWFFFFHAFSAATSLAASVIRAPTSSLALSAFQELENGVALFESARIGSRPRDELPILKRLRDRAAEKLVLHRSGSRKNKKALKPTNDGLTDDLDLIGDDAHRRQSGTLAGPSASGTTTPTTLSTAQVALPAQANAGLLPPPLSADDPAPDPGSIVQSLQYAYGTAPPPPSASSDALLNPSQLPQPPVTGGAYFFPTTLDEAIASQQTTFPTDFDEFASWTSDPNFGMGGASGGAFGFSEPERLGMYHAHGGQVEDFDFETFMQGIGVAANDSSASAPPTSY